MMLGKSIPALTPEDLGIDLEEDSPDATEEDVAAAIETDSLEDFTQKVAEFIGSQKANFELRLRSGILYSRVSLEDGQCRLFNIDWIRKGFTP